MIGDECIHGLAAGTCSLAMPAVPPVTLDPVQRARKAADASWANTTDRAARTESARRSFDARFATPAERSAHFRDMAARSAEARRAKRAPAIEPVPPAARQVPQPPRPSGRPHRWDVGDKLRVPSMFYDMAAELGTPPTRRAGHASHLAALYGVGWSPAGDLTLAEAAHRIGERMVALGLAEWVR